jgi:transmembrane sensor
VEYLNDDIDNLIGKYLAGEATAAERAFVEGWRAGDPANEKYFNDLKEIFRRVGTINDVQQFDADLAWQKMHERLTGGKTVQMTPGRSLFPYLRVAAAVLLLAVASFVIYRYLQAPAYESVEIASTGTTKSDTLPDGTNVFLNKSSQIAYEYNPKQKQHTVKLKGEAYFEMRHAEEKNFIVSADDVFIRDIGTVFNVKAYPDSAFVEVVVDEGEVSLFTNQNDGIRVKANEKGRYDKRSKTFTLLKPAVNETAYKTRIFAFTDSELSEIVSSLNDVYDKKIEINDSIAACRVSVNFHNDDINEIAEIIAETLGLRITQTGSVIRLEGPGCGQ